MSEPTWKTWIQMQIIGRHCEQSLKHRLGSSNKLTRLINDPTVATHAEVLIFAEELDMHPFVLLDTYQLGFGKLTVEEKNFLRSHYVNKNLLFKQQEELETYGLRKQVA